ncbi:MAG: tyrosine-type recombinase/integrase [Actinomycetota bacterium]
MLSMPPFLAEILSAHLAAAPASEFVFVGPKGALLRRSNFRSRHWKIALAAAGLAEELRFHDLRHSCAALLIAHGAHPKEIQGPAGSRQHHDDAQHLRAPVAVAGRDARRADGGNVPQSPGGCGLNVA